MSEPIGHEMSRIEINELNRDSLKKLASEGHVQFIEPGTFVCFKADKNVRIRFLESEGKGND